MTQPRYQIFVSSTFKDLEEERQAVLNAILKLNQFPAGMEIFPAVNDTAWEHIEKVIEVSDYYVLIIGGKYGSIEAESGISYTEKEYDFAISKNIPVLAFTRSDEDSIPVGKAEMKEEIREKLKQFKQKVGARHHWNYWNSIDELKANVATSLAMSFATNPQKGWVKAGGVDKTELLERYAELQQKFDGSQREIHKLKQLLLTSENSKSLSQADEIIVIEIKNYPSNEEIEVSWNELFSIIGQYLTKSAKIADYEMNNVIKNSLLNKAISQKKLEADSSSDDYYRNNRINDTVVEQIGHQFIALDLIKISFDRQGHHYWALTDKGRKYFAYLNAIHNDGN
jgi:Domain of unknown function (DUF4062)